MESNLDFTSSGSVSNDAKASGSSSVTSVKQAQRRTRPCSERFKDNIAFTTARGVGRILAVGGHFFPSKDEDEWSIK